MKDIFVSSDLHLCHENILKFKDKDGNLIRPGFDNVDHMNQYILEMHNSVVKPGDIYYCLGDVTMSNNKEEFGKLWAKFQGSKRLCLGNHDDVKFLASGGWFKKIQYWRIFREFDLLLSHVPLHQSSLWNERTQRTTFQVHGHTHANGSPEGPYKSVCVEMIDYTPVHIEDLAKIAREYNN